MPKPFRPTAAFRRAARRALVTAPAVLALAAFPGCTDLTETPVDALTPATTFRTPSEIQAGLTSVYAALRGPNWAYYNLNEVTTDAQVVPTRGSDWGDNGRWLELHRQGWTPNSGSALDDMNSAWGSAYTGIARANLVINAIRDNNVTGQDGVVAELRFLRAWYYYQLMDFFGGVPIVTTTDIQPRARATRAEVFAFVEKELTEARAALPETPAQPGRVTRWSADALLANLYLNAREFTGTPTPTGVTPGAPKWNEAITAAERVINSGRFSLASNFLSVFAPDNDENPEHIFVTKHVAQAGLGMQVPMRALHYNSVNPGAWNGWAATAETYNKFDAADARRSAILQGPQTSFVTGAPITERNGTPLNFTVNIGNVAAATEGEGTRVVKYRPAVVAPDGNHPNDLVWLRLGEMYMIRAEARFRLGNTAGALADLNLLRARAFNPARPLTTLDETTLLNERLFEFIGEGKRRQDLVRFGRYTQATQFKPTASPPYKVLFPIPQLQIQTNPLLTQNPGY